MSDKPFNGNPQSVPGLLARFRAATQPRTGPPCDDCAGKRAAFGVDLGAAPCPHSSTLTTTKRQP